MHGTAWKREIRGLHKVHQQFPSMKVFEHHSSPEQLPTPELVMCILYYEEKRKREHMAGSSARAEAKVRVLEVFPTDLWAIFFL